MEGYSIPPTVRYTYTPSGGRLPRKENGRFVKRPYDREETPGADKKKTRPAAIAAGRVVLRRDRFFAHAIYSSLLESRLISVKARTKTTSTKTTKVPETESDSLMAM